MNPSLPGLHHVTAITADAQKNIDFYCGTLGLRLVKLTVNFDDPGSYHLYYGDELGSPGSIMTFFAWPGAGRGRIGPPQATVTAFATTVKSIGFWASRLQEQNISATVSTRFGEELLSFMDPDGLKLELIGTQSSRDITATGGPIPKEHAIRSFHSVTLSEEGYENTAGLLTEVMGFRLEASEGNRFRYRASGGGPASLVDLLCVPDARRGSMGAGVVHHVAFRTPDDSQQKLWHEKIARLGHNVSPVMDRSYFHSIYFREPGGVLFEIATDNPGFTADQPLDQLGQSLNLPPWLEPARADWEKVLPRLKLPSWSAA